MVMNPSFENGTYPGSSTMNRLYQVYLPRVRARVFSPRLSRSSLTRLQDVVNRTRRFFQQASIPRVVARWVFPHPLLPRKRIFYPAPFYAPIVLFNSTGFRACQQPPVSGPGQGGRISAFDPAGNASSTLL